VRADQRGEPRALFSRSDDVDAHAVFERVVARN
jgi:hypothetical protein